MFSFIPALLAGLAANEEQTMSKHKRKLSLPNPLQQQPPTVVVAKKKMKKWPDDPSKTIPYNQLIDPLKTIIMAGYRLFRKDLVKEFDYEGYNIGKREQSIYQSPSVRLKEKPLTAATKEGKNLIDVILNIAFLLGIEQGRRVSYRDQKSAQELNETLETYRDSNKDLRIRIDELESYIEAKNSNPNLSNEDLSLIIKEKVRSRRAIRLEEHKKELALDKTKNVFKIKTPIKSKFKDLSELASSLNKETCSKEQWNELLIQRGWTYDEWKVRCNKKNFKSDF